LGSGLKLGELGLEQVVLKVVKKRDENEWFAENSEMAHFSILAITFYLLIRMRSNWMLNTPKTFIYKIE
jgi:hypothetical protein